MGKCHKYIQILSASRPLSSSSYLLFPSSISSPILLFTLYLRTSSLMIESQFPATRGSKFLSSAIRSKNRRLSRASCHKRNFDVSTPISGNTPDIARRRLWPWYDRTVLAPWESKLMKGEEMKQSRRGWNKMRGKRRNEREIERVKGRKRSSREEV